MTEVRTRNQIFNQKKVSDFISCYFAILGVGCSIVASEINFFYNVDNKNNNWIKMLLTVSNVATLFLSKSQSFFSNPYVVLSITTSYFLYLNTIPNLTQPENENEVFEI